MFHLHISYVVVAQSSRRSPARLEVVSSNPVGVEIFFSFSFSYINVYKEKVHRNKAFASLALKKKLPKYHICFPMKYDIN